MVQLTPGPIDIAQLYADVERSHCGAIVLFTGTVREVTDGRRTLALDYEAYAGMAERQMADIESEVRSRWPIGEIRLAHRLGHLTIGEISVAVAVSSPHREEAFAACRYAIEQLKARVAIWKKENWSDGQSSWIHPGYEEACDVPQS
jgi:molybdopterin synthase catalytic subunit